MSHRVRILITGLVVAFVLAGTQVAAGIVVDSREFSGGQTRLDFDDLAVGTAVTLQYQTDGVTFALEGTSLEPVLLSDSPPRFFGSPGVGLNALTNSVGAAIPYPNLEITFSSPVNRIAFEIRTTVNHVDHVLHVHGYRNTNSRFADQVRIVAYHAYGYADTVIAVSGKGLAVALGARGDSIEDRVLLVFRVTRKIVISPVLRHARGEHGEVNFLGEVVAADHVGLRRKRGVVPVSRSVHGHTVD